MVVLVFHVLLHTVNVAACIGLRGTPGPKYIAAPGRVERQNLSLQRLRLPVTKQSVPIEQLDGIEHDEVDINVGISRKLDISIIAAYTELAVSFASSILAPAWPP